MISPNAGMLRNLALVALLVCGMVLTLVWPRRARRRIALRAKGAVSRNRTAQTSVPGLPSASLWLGLARRFALLGERAPVFDATQRFKLARRLTSAGFRDRRAPSVMIGCKLFTGGVLALGAIALGPHVPRIGEYFVFRALMMAAALVVGMILPESVLDLLVRRRQKQIAPCLPDALDLLVICTNAGNSLVVGIKRVANELTDICPPLADELSVTADELQIGSDSATALHNLASRIGLPSVRALVTTLIQSQKYGTPITQSLRMLSRTERAAQMVALEEKAAKLATKMTMPMMLFILPTVGLIAAGPAVIRLLAVFR